MPLTQARLKELLHYDPKTGVFTWRINLRSRVCAGERAGSLSSKDGIIPGHRICIQIERKRYFAHRLAFLYMEGEFPANVVDHRDGDGLNNKWKNLRHADTFINAQNQRKAMSNNKAGFLGVSFAGNKFRANIFVGGRTFGLGSFATRQEAYAAYLIAKRKLHPGCTI